MTDTSTAVTLDSTPVVKKHKGRKVSPTSKFSLARVLLANLPAEKLNHKDAVKELVAQLGVTEGTANVYYYNARKPVVQK